MKKTVKTALFAALICFSSSMFAAEPVSFLKGTTFDLFEDEIVDNLAWGIEDADGLVLGAFDASNNNFKIGAGTLLGPLWWSIYDTGTFSVNKSSVQEITNDTVADDGVNTDYVDIKTDTYKKFNAANSVANKLFISFATDSWGIQSYWIVSDDTGSAGDKYGKESFNDEKHAAGTVDSKNTKIGRYDGTNTFGFNFNDIGGFDLTNSNLYFQLNNFEVQWSKNSYKESYKDTDKLDGTVWRTDDYNHKDVVNKFTPKIGMEMGFDLPELGAMSTRFVLGEEFYGRFAITKKQTTQTVVDETYNEKKTTKTTTIEDQKGTFTNRFTWNNKLTPIFLFDFDVGERLKVKAAAGADVTVYNSPGNKNNTTTTITEETTYDKINKTTTSSYQKEVTNSTYRNQTTDSIFTDVEANTALAFVYQVKPEKFNINLGIKWNAVNLIWEFSKTTNQTVKTSNYKEETDAVGNKFVTIDSVDYNKPEDATADGGRMESQTVTFKSIAASAPSLQLGATWFITEKATLDLAYSGSFGTGTFGILTGGNGGLLGSSLKLMLSVQF